MQKGGGIGTSAETTSEGSTSADRGSKQDIEPQQDETRRTCRLRNAERQGLALDSTIHSHLMNVYIPYASQAQTSIDC